MRFVDHDPQAAQLAALRCREAAVRLRHAAAAVESSVGRTAWWGATRDRVVHEVAAVAAGLRREAIALEDSAELLDRSARAAWRAELAAAERHRRQLRASTACSTTRASVGAR